MNYYLTYKGERKKVQAPLIKVLIVLILLIFVIVSLPIHLVLWIIGFRGFWDEADKAYTLQNPFKWRGWV